jgi:hypothetical protein
MKTSSYASTRGRFLEALGAVLAAWVGLAISTPAQATSVETYVLTIGGQSQLGPNFACATFGPATPALSFFANVGPGIPTEGLAFCGIGGGFRTTTVAGAGPLSDSRSLSTTFNNGANAFSGTALALARAGSVLASSNATFTGPSNSLIDEGASSYGLFVDRLTASSPSVAAATAGAIRLTFTVDGVVSVAGPPPLNATADVEVNYSVAGGPSFILMRAQANRSDLVPFAASGTGAPLTGFTAAPGSFGGAGQVQSFLVPFTWGQPFDLKVGVLAAAIPGPGMSALVDFTRGVTLTGIELQANGQTVTDFTITSESGTSYGPNGVPEPATSAMTLAGVASLAGLARRRGRAAVR